MVNLDNYEECDPEHSAACRCVVGKAIFMRYENQLEGVEEWQSGCISRLTRDQLGSIGGTFYKPKEKFLKSEFVEFNYAGCVLESNADVGDAVRYMVSGCPSDYGCVKSKRFKITVEEL